MIDVSPGIEYNVRRATDSDARFIVETTARVRQPRSLTWWEWQPYGMQWAEFHFNGDPGDNGGAWVVEAKGVLLGFVLCANESTIRTVEMLFVKKDFRGLGLGQLLLDVAGFDAEVPCRAPTDSLRMWARKRGIKLAVVE